MVDEEPRIRPLGMLAVGFGFIALVLSPNFFLIAWAFLAALVGLSLGMLVRMNPATRGTGGVAILLSVAAIVVSGVVILQV